MIKFTGDRTTDRILNIWWDWYCTKNKNAEERFEQMTDYDIDELVYRVGMEDFVTYVLEEFPAMEDVGSTYDVESTWDLFLTNTRVGYDVEEALSEFMEDFKIDNSLVSEYVDLDYITENYDYGDLDNFFELNPIGKKMFAKDKKALLRSFEEGVFEEFSNGWTFAPNEYVDVIMSEDDKEGHNYEDIRKELNNYKDWAKKGYLIKDGYISNPRLYNYKDIHFCYLIDLAEIASHADLKSKKNNNDDGEDIPF